MCVRASPPGGRRLLPLVALACERHHSPARWPLDENLLNHADTLWPRTSTPSRTPLILANWLRPKAIARRAIPPPLTTSPHPRTALPLGQRPRAPTGTR
ncbi:MAG: hypothetical protein PHN61_14490, partial [Methanothrix sp.]|nr:hypothetical protein [Methanothrix sp.]